MPGVDIENESPVLGRDGILRFAHQDQFDRELAENISQGRLFFSVEGELPAGPIVKISLLIPSNSSIIELRGKPVVKTETQMGLVLENFDANLLKHIAQKTTDESQGTEPERLKAATEELVHQLSQTSQAPSSSDDDALSNVQSLAIAGMAMTSAAPLQDEWNTLHTPTHPRPSPLGNPGMSAAASPAHENLKMRAEAAEKRVYEFQFYVQQVLTQLSHMTRRAEAAEHYGMQMQQRAEYAEYLVGQKESKKEPVSNDAKQKRKAEWIQSRIVKSRSKTAEFDVDYLQSLELLANGSHQNAVELLKKIVQRDPKTLSYRTALHLAEGFQMQEQGMNPELTRRFERAMLVEANEDRAKPSVTTKK
jgi:hypothetical protein